MIRLKYHPGHRVLTSFTIFLLVFLPLMVKAQPGRPPANVVVTPIVQETVQEEVVLIGVVESWRASTVASEVTGRVDELSVRRGQKVKKGQVLARLGDRNLILKLKETRAKRDATQARLAMAKDILERSQKLMEGQAISDKDHRRAKLSLEEMKGDLAAIDAEILQFEDELYKKEIRAPFSGIVTREETEVGEWVEIGGEIVHIVDLSKVRIIVEIPEQYVPGVKENEAVIVRIDALGPEKFKAKIHALIPEGHRDARIFPLEIHVQNPALRIKEGMLAKVQFNLGLARRVVMVHKDAIITRGSQTYMFIVNGTEAKQVFVTTGQAQGDLIEIIGPVEFEQNAVIRGNERLRNGQSVQVVSPSE